MVERYKSPFEKMDKMNESRSDLDKRLEISTPEAFVEWLVVAKGLHEEHRDNVVSNLKRSMTGERIKGQLSPKQIDVDISLFGLRILRIKSR